MKSYLKIGILCAAALVGSLVGSPSAQAAEPAAAKAATTLDNLQAAYNGESNAKARYEAFAKKADEEGYKSVASLFRAAAMSEGIHAAKHAKTIKGMKAEPTATVAAPEVKSTKENLEAAIAGETAEAETMYPAFIKQAAADKNTKAVRSFKGAMVTEVEHAKLYKQALAELDGWKAGDKAFFVCQVCGFTLMGQAPATCPLCHEPREKFLQVK